MKISFPLKNRLNLLGHPATGMLPSVWLKQILKFGFHWTMFPKVIVITIIVIFNFFLVLLEKIFFHKKIRKVDVKSPVFILGHPRSGTTLLHYLLALDQNIATPLTYQTLIPNTFRLTGGIVKPIFKAFMPKKRPMDEMAMGPDLPKEEEFGIAGMTTSSLAHGFYFPNNMDEIFKQTVLFETDKSTKRDWQNALEYFSKKVLMSSKGKRLLLKSPYNTARISAILEIFPDAKFIHIKRDPKNVYPSFLKLLDAILPVLSFQKPNTNCLDDFIDGSYVDVYRAYFEQKKMIPEGNLMELSLEAYLEEPYVKLENIFNFIGGLSYQSTKPALEKYLSENEPPPKDSYNQDNSQLKKFPEKWNEVSRALGYS